MILMISIILLRITYLQAAVLKLILQRLVAPQIQRFVTLDEVQRSVNRRESFGEEKKRN